jgi:hypothetical protein
MDPQIRLLLEVAYEAMLDAGKCFLGSLIKEIFGFCTISVLTRTTQP